MAQDNSKDAQNKGQPAEAQPYYFGGVQIKPIEPTEDFAQLLDEVMIHASFT